MEHVGCVQNSSAPQHACARCGAPLRASLEHSAIGETIARRARSTPALRALLPEVERFYPEARASRGKEREQIEMRKANKDEEVLEGRNAGLRVTETDLGRSISRVGMESSGNDGHDRKTGRNLVETRVEIGMEGVKGSGKWERRPRGDAGGMMMRRGLKKGGRMWTDLKKWVAVNRRQVTIGVLFAVCVVSIVILAGGQNDEDTSVGTGRDVVEEVSLPNVRVNPTLLKEARERARLTGEGEEGESREDVTGAAQNVGRVGDPLGIGSK